MLPKGHIEPGEDPRVTAVREVREETGHWAKEGLARFLLEPRKEQKARRPEERQPHWLPVDAIEREQQVFPETKALLRKAATKIAEIKSASKAGRITHQT